MTATGPRVVFRFAVSITVAIDTDRTATYLTAERYQRAIERQLKRDIRSGYDDDITCELLDYEVKDGGDS